MICASCAAGADLLDAPALPEPALKLAAAFHDECSGCCCQHLLPGVDELAARRARRGYGGLAVVMTALAAPKLHKEGRIA